MTEISRRTLIESAAALAVPPAATLAAAGTAWSATGTPADPAPCEPQTAATAATIAPSQTAGASQELAHYYRFQEIVEGRELVHRSGQWRFEGCAITLDPHGVHPMVDDPRTTRLPHGSQAHQASQACDRVYTDLLGALQRVFDGHPEELRHATQLMFQLEEHAAGLAQMTYPPGHRTVLGPAFQVAESRT
jgi:hypothetical protein